MNKSKLITTLLIATAFTNAYAQGFQEIWKDAQKNSLSAKSYEAKLNSIEIAKKNLENHWYPKLYLDSSIYQTNDPAYSFMGKLNQRSIEMGDLMDGMQISDSLNNPSMSQYQRHTIGAYLPIYEGGSKHYAAKSKKHLYEATADEKKHADALLYSEIAKFYGMHLIAQKNYKELQIVDDEINQILSHYKLGTKNNPLGRSGLLGLKTLKKRIEAEKEHVKVIEQTVLSALKELSQKASIDIKKENLEQFVEENFKNKITISDDESLKVKSLKKMVKVAQSYKDAAKAHYLPQVGVFAQNNIYNGDRDQATSQMVGLNVKWEFFNLTTFGTSKEVAAQALAAEAYAKAIAQQEYLQDQSNMSKQTVIENNLKRLQEALNEMKEQTSINYRLFKNGIINVLQLSQVLSSKLDLIRFYADANKEYLNTWAALYINNIK